jgi:rsbT co-antagonist protein RsbR
MADEVETTLSGLEDQVAHRTADLERQRAALSQALDNLQASTDERLSLIETIRQLSTPVIQVYERIILIPLIGMIDANRMQQIETAMLMGIEKSHAQKVILDLTGVPIIDSTVAAFLSRLPRLAQLLGAEVTMVGIAPEVAESLVHLGVDFSGTITRSNLQSGVLYALRSLGFVITQSETKAVRYSAERRN